MSTEAFIIEHCRKYPGLQIQDVFKALFQSAFGCEHLIADPSAAEKYILREAETCRPHKGNIIERLDGSFFRVHLDIIKSGVCADVLAKAFALSAEHIDGAAELLESKLEVFKALALEGRVPFDAQSIVSLSEEWKQQGYPAIHHSQEFRNLYAPAYRLVAEKYIHMLKNAFI